MFEEQDKQSSEKENSSQENTQEHKDFQGFQNQNQDQEWEQDETQFFNMKKVVILAGGILFLFLIVWASISYFSPKGEEQLTEGNPTEEEDKDKESEQNDKQSSSTEEDKEPPIGLPDNEKTKDPQDQATSTSEFSQIEYLSFSDFYEKPESKWPEKINTYELPLSVKVDVLNYYDVSRKLNLDPAIENLNNKGFAVLDNPFEEEYNNFYGAYNKLSERDVPVTVTSDFMWYYYQHKLKKVFKDIESSSFYNSLWEINKQMYNKAKIRYENRLNKIGNVNDPILEGQRLALAYFAVTLEILEPTEAQITETDDLGGGEGFTPGEAGNYNFSLPEYLEDDVAQEVKLIKEHKKTTDSPVLLYERDYSEFTIPKEYKENPRLSNFYLSTEWLNSVFPLYYESEECPECELDKADWRINFIAAQYITRDIANDENLKGKWARIYKVLAFFQGLRDNLTYVNYRDASAEVFGDDYSIKELFKNLKLGPESNFVKARNKLEEFNFLPIQGALDKTKQKNKSKLGFKFLADPYWPNDHIFEKLSYPETGSYLGKDWEEKESNITACKVDGENKAQRCNGFGLDVINLVKEVPDTNDYFVENTNYEKYSQKSKSLKVQLDKLDNWRDNNYWTTLKTINNSFETSSDKKPVYMKNKAWKNHKIDTSLGAWTNLQLPIDKLEVYTSTNNQRSGLTGGTSISDVSKYNYVEPNLVLVNELIANTNMILDMLYALEMEQEVGSFNIRLKDLKQDLISLKEIIKKELKGEELNEEQVEFIDSFIKKYRVQKEGRNHFEIKSSSEAKDEIITESLKGVKLMAIINKQANGDKVISVGPVFDYWEHK